MIKAKPSETHAYTPLSIDFVDQSNSKNNSITADFPGRTCPTGSDLDFTVALFVLGFFLFQSLSEGYKLFQCFALFYS